MAVSSAHPGDRPLHARRRLLLLAAGVASYGLLRLLEQDPALVERAYATTLSPLIIRPLSLLTGALPFSLAEWFVAAVIGRQLVAFAFAARDVARHTRGARNAIACGLLRLGQDAGVLIAVGYLAFGLNFARPRLDVRLGLVAGEPAGDDELAALTGQLVDAADSAYVELHGTIDAGVPTAMPADRGRLLAALDSGWARATRELGLPVSSARRYGAPKYALTSWEMHYAGVSGMFFPLTGEALLDRDVPASALVKVMAHEQAHQRGTGVEGDANALAYFVCALSPDPLVRYAGLSFARGQLLGELAGVDTARYRALWRRVGPGSRRDLRAVYEEGQRAYVVRSRVATRVIDVNLRLNGVREGVRSYGLSTLLFIAYARAHGGVIVPR